MLYLILVHRTLKILVRTQVHFERGREFESAERGGRKVGGLGDSRPKHASGQGQRKLKLHFGVTGWVWSEVLECL